MTRVRSFLMTAAFAAAALWLSVAPTVAQTVISSTTTTAAVDARTQLIPLTAVTGIGAGTRNLVGDLLYMDDEAMQVNAIDTTAKIATVRRGVQGTKQVPHASGVVVWFGPAQRFAIDDFFGGCTATSEQFLPKINIRSGRMFDCLGGQWVQVDAPGAMVLGTTVASVAGVITPTGNFFKVSGTAAITGITVPNGWAAGMCLAIEPTGIFTTTTATNIVLASTAVVGKVLFECWDGAKWAPSY